MKFRTLKWFAAIAAIQISLGTAAAFAASVVPMDLEQIVAAAEHIVHVRCTGNSVQADPTVGVVTVTTFIVLDRAKGGNDSTFTVRQVGGELNGLAIDYHVPKFRVGQEYVLFMPPASKLGLASPVGLAQGAFAVAPGAAGTKEVGNGRDFGELLGGVDPASLPPGVRARLHDEARPRTPRMDLREFMAMTRAKAVRQ